MSVHPLRTARCLRNLTIKQLADAARVGTSTVWRAEHNYPINAESRRRLCMYFTMTSQELGLVSTENVAPPVGESGPLPELSSACTADEPAPPSEMQDHAGDGPELSYERQIGEWLAARGSSLTSLLDTGLTLDEVLNSLRVVLYGSQGLPVLLRNKLLYTQGVAMQTRKRVSLEERTHLHKALLQSVEEGWQLFHISRPLQVLVTTQAQLYLVRQTQDWIEPETRCALYAALYNLLGAAFFYQGRYELTQQACKNAYRAAAEGSDNWDSAQSLNWQAIASNARGLYMDAIRTIEAALKLIKNEEEEKFLRLRAHLLADRAYNASLIQENVLVKESLDSSAELLEPLGPHEEFDRSRWYQLAGSSMLIIGDYKMAIDYLQQSLSQLPAQWQARRILTLVPLAEAYARKRDRDASLAVARHIASIIGSVDSTMLNHRFLEYQQILLETFPHDKQVLSFVTNMR